MITKSIKTFIAAYMMGCALGVVFTSCQDILDTESSRQNIEPDINSKTDSVFYAYGILQAMQQLADQYVLQGEVRGDLVKTTIHTENSLRQFYDFSYDASLENKYDSAYLYYRVINNCNYYLAHRDTALYTGSTNVVIQEYAGIQAIRAWAYLQLGRNYERVPFFTEPLTEISKINDNNFPMLDLNGIVSALAPELSKYSGMATPNYGYENLTGHNIGTPNWSSTSKLIAPRFLFVPIDVVLGDMYLETNQYEQAVRSYTTYLTRVARDNTSPRMAAMISKNAGLGRYSSTNDSDLPDRSLFSVTNYGNTDSWSPIFGMNNAADLITYIPMAVNSRNGCTTNLPLIYGFNFYATSEERRMSDLGGVPYVFEIQLLPSDVLNTLSDSTEFYYYYEDKAGDAYDSIQAFKAGDMRLRNITTQYYNTEDETTTQWMDKFKNANIILYRTSTVLLHLAEALNRLDMPDAAFAILKDGLSTILVEQTSLGEYYCSYMSDYSRTQLQKAGYPLSTENAPFFPPYERNANGGIAARGATGIHCHGAGYAASDMPAYSGTGGTNYNDGKSPYRFDRIVGMKLTEIASTFGVAVGTTKQDTINAVEDLLCDEYALELAFEGTRFYDLCRLARHKNANGTYGGNFGSLWLARKLQFKNPQKDLSNPSNWYLPFK